MAAFVLRDLLLLTVAIGGWSGTAAIAQVIPDGTLGSRVTGTCLLSHCTISGGTREGDNLFHSFLSFNVLGGREATFAHDPDVSRIFGRLNTLLNTAALIDGKLKTNGASLFLLSPGGIIFGPQSQLDVGATFVGTSANQVTKTGFGQFGFNLLNQPDLNVLFSGAPDTFHFGNSPGTIRLSGNASSPVFNPNPGGAIALIGGPVVIENRTILLPRQHLFLGGLSGNNGQARISGNQISLEYSSSNTLENVSISDSSLVANGASLNGEVKIETRDFSLINSSISSRSNTAENGVQVISSTKLTLTNSTISTESLGLGGNINLTADQGIELKEASQILTRAAAGSSFAGNIEINAENLNLNSLSSVTTDTPAFGGNLAIQLEKRLELDQSTLIQTRAGQPEGGYLSIVAKELKTDARDDADIIAIGPRNNLLLSYDKLSGFIPSSPPQRDNRLSEIGHTFTPATTLSPEPPPPAPSAQPTDPGASEPGSVTSFTGGLSSLQNAIQNNLQNAIQNNFQNNLQNNHYSTPVFSDIQESQASAIATSQATPGSVQARTRQAGEVRDHCRSDTSQGRLRLRLSGRGGLPPVAGRLQAQTPLVDLGIPPQEAVLKSRGASEPVENLADATPPRAAHSSTEASHWQRLRDGRIRLLGAESVVMYWQRCQG